MNFLIFEKTKCRFLIIMLVLSMVVMFFLNFYIAYEAIQYLKKPDLGMGLIVVVFGVFAAYLFVIPLTSFTILSIRWVRYDKKNKFIVPVFLGVSGVLAGLILSNAFDYWILIVAFSALLLFSCFLCDRIKDQPVQINDTHRIATKVMEEKSGATKNDTGLDKSKTVPGEEVEDLTGGTFNKVKAIQIVGLVVLLPVMAGFSISPYIQVFIKVPVLLAFGLHFWVTVAFLKKNGRALKIKYIVNFGFLGITIILFLVFLIAKGISFTSGSLAVFFSFILLIAVIVYQAFSYKKIKQSSLFKMLIIGVVGAGLLQVTYFSGKVDRGVKKIAFPEINDFAFKKLQFFEVGIDDIKLTDRIFY